MTRNNESTQSAAISLEIAVSRLRARLREEAHEESTGVTVSQIAMLQRLDEHGSLSASQLATMEHVTQQAIAQRIALLKPTSYIALTADPADRRRTLISLTQEGRTFLEDLVHSREEWLATAIAETIAPAERENLRAAIDLLNRLASADVDAMRAPR